MSSKNLHKTINFLIAAVWVVNGLFCKVLNIVPRHEQIVAEILGNEYSRNLTILIGLSETVMGIWILTGFKSKLNAVAQIAVVAVMNTLELFLVPDLLLWGELNSFFAMLFIGLVYYNEFVLKKRLKLQA